MFDEDTITALATPPGEGGIGIIRVSGKNALEILRNIFVTKNKQKLIQPQNRYFYHGYITDLDDTLIDEVLVVFMKSPATYTTEDILEVHCHGGMFPIQKVLQRILQSGVRLAQPGEFTKRAFLNGRIDLVQAEGIMDLIAAKSEEAAKASLNQMEGLLSKRILSMRDRLLSLLAHIEVTVDYPEEDIEEVFIETVIDTLKVIKEESNILLDSASQGKLIREGIKTVIIGKPNVGKSSLLNALVRENRAIVTDIPGTTRDTIEEYITIKGILVKIMDTAGIRDTMDRIEQIGIDRSKALITQADLILFILDASKPFEKEDKDILLHLDSMNVLVILNKTDMDEIIDHKEVQKAAGSAGTVIRASMLTGVGIAEIEDYIYRMVYTGKLSTGSGMFITNNRHKEALISADKCLMEALEAIQHAMPLDLVSIDIRNAWNALGEITGESVTENLIDKIFSEFCLGK